jgi:hypothetical protein
MNERTERDLVADGTRTAEGREDMPKEGSA